MKVKQQISEMFLFSGLSLEEFETVYSLLPKEITVEKGSEISLQDRFQRALCIVLSGELRVFRKGSDGKNQMCNRLLSGNAFGVASLYTNESPISSVVVYKTSKILCIPEELLTKLWKEYPSIAQNFIVFLTDKIRFLNQTMNVSRGSQNEKKVEMFLRQYADDTGEIHLPVSLSGLATRLNMGRSSLYRALECLQMSGILEKAGKTFRFKE